MPVTRSKATVTEITLTQTVKVEKPRAARKAKVNGKIVSKASKGNRNIEHLFALAEVPKDLLLPSEFEAYHDLRFIEGVKHILSIDPTLYPVVVHLKFRAFSNEEKPIQSERDTILHYWYALISSVIGQQVSGSAAKAIESRFSLSFEGKPTPEKTLLKTDEELRAVGLLKMKAKYVRHISETFAQPGELTSLAFYSTPKEDVIKGLTQLMGIGEWSAKMFAVFTLRELDIFAFDDLGVARGVARYLENRPEMLAKVKEGVHAVEELKKRLTKRGKFQTKSSKRTWTPLHDEYVKYLGLMFAPYQLVFMLIMWRLASTNVEVLENVRD